MSLFNLETPMDLFLSKTGILIENIISKKRNYELAIDRIIMSNFLLENGYSLVQVSRRMQKNHATIIYYRKTFEDKLKFEPVFKKRYLEIKEKLEA